MKRLLTVLAILPILASCTKEKEGSILIRIDNQSPYNLQHVVVYSLNSSEIQTPHSYGDIAPRSNSSYQNHDKVRDFPLFSFIKDGVTEDINSIRCGNGISELAPGRYSLLIDGNSTGITVVRFLKD